MPNGFTNVELKAAFKQNQQQRKCAECMSDFDELTRPGKVQNGAEDHARSHQNDNVRHASPVEKPVRRESKDKQSTQQTEEHRNVHIALMISSVTVARIECAIVTEM